MSLPFSPSLFHSAFCSAFCSSFFVRILSSSFPKDSVRFAPGGAAAITPPAAAALVEEVEYVFRGGFGRVVVFGIPNIPDSYKGDSECAVANRIERASEARLPAMTPHLDFHDHREERKTPADFHDFARAASSGCGVRPVRPSHRRLRCHFGSGLSVKGHRRSPSIVFGMDGVGDRKRGRGAGKRKPAMSVERTASR